MTLSNGWRRLTIIVCTAAKMHCKRGSKQKAMAFYERVFLFNVLYELIHRDSGKGEELSRPS